MTNAPESDDGRTAGGSARASRVASGEPGSAVEHGISATTSGSPTSTEVGIIPSTLSLIERIARDPTIDIERLERMLAFQERLMARQAEMNWHEAMNRCQEEIQPVARATENTVTRSFYAKLEAVDAAIRPIYLKHGFAVLDNTVEPLVAGNIRIECRVTRGGHVEKFYREAPPDTLGPKGSPTKTTLHGGASTETFLRRYARCGAFNVVFKDLDNDGNGALSQDEVDHIVDLMKQAKAGAKFMKLMWRTETIEDAVKRFEKAGSLEAAVATIAAKDYQKAISTLKEQIRKAEANAHT